LKTNYTPGRVLVSKEVVSHNVCKSKPHSLQEDVQGTWSHCCDCHPTHNNTLKLTLVVELHCESAFVSLLANAHSLQLPLAVQLSRKANKDSNHTTVIATMQQTLMR